MDATSIDLIGKLVGNVGAPIAITFYVLFKLDKRLGAIEAAIVELIKSKKE